MTKQQKEELKQTFKEIGSDIVWAAAWGFLGFLVGALLMIDASEKKVDPPAPIQEVKIQTYDTLTNDNAHFSKITIDSVEFIFVKYGNQIDLERLK